MIKFPSIDQFRNVIRHVKTHAQYSGKDENGDAIIDPSKPIPTLKFRGTVKLHGTNAGIDPKKLGSAIANVARPWYIKRFNESA